MKDAKPCKTPFDEIRHHLAPPQPVSSGMRLVLSAITKLGKHYNTQFQERTENITADSEQRYRDICIQSADDIYSRIPEDAR